MTDAPDAKDAIARLFSATSDSHDTIGTPLFRHFGRLLVQRAELKDGDHVLDVAAGTGATLFPAAEAVGQSGRVIGVDLAPGMVDQLRALIDSRRVANAEALVADAEELPFEDQAFDAVICGFALFFFPDPARALGEFRRVLLPGGRLAVSTFTKEGSASIERVWSRIAAHLPGPPPPPEDHVAFDEPEQLHEALERGGFVQIEIEESPLDLVLPDFAAWWAWLWTMEFRAYLERADREALQGLRTTAADEFAAQAGAPQIRIRMDALLARARRHS